MAFGNNNARGGSSFARKPVASTAVQNKADGAVEKAEEIFSTGMFVPDREGVTAMASIQVKETVTIPAGSYINIYDNSQTRKSDTSPHYRLVVKAGKQK